MARPWFTLEFRPTGTLVVAVAALILGLAGCSGSAPQPARSEPETGITEERGTGCGAHARVVLVSVADGTHPWPGSPAAAADPTDSAAGRAYDATGAILTFFARTRS